MNQSPNPVAILLWSVAGVGVVLCLIAVGVAYVRARRLAKAPPPPPARCPSCGSEQIDIFESGFWDGINTGGGFQVGTCQRCGTHCEHRSAWNPENQQVSYTDRLVTEDEWQEYYIQPAARREQRLREEAP